MEAADEGHSRQKHAAEGRSTEEAPSIAMASAVGQAPEAADLGCHGEEGCAWDVCYQNKAGRGRARDWGWQL